MRRAALADFTSGDSASRPDYYEAYYQAGMADVALGKRERCRGQFSQINRAERRQVL